MANCWFVPPGPQPLFWTQKCRFYNFHAVFGHFAQIVPYQSTPFGKPCILYAIYTSFDLAAVFKGYFY